MAAVSLPVTDEDITQPLRSAVVRGRVISSLNLHSGSTRDDGYVFARRFGR